jgi:uncharacterized delta-60 repeat protein
MAQPHAAISWLHRRKRSPYIAAIAAVLMAATSTTLAQAASWHLVASFGKGGVAGLPVRERLQEPPNQGAPSPPERYRSLLVPGPQGSVLVGGYANSKPGAFIVSRISPTGKLVKSFGHGGVSIVPAIYWVKQAPPRMLALAGGSVLIVGINHADNRFVTVRLNARGQPDRSFGHDGIAQYKLANAHRFTIVTAAVVQSDGDIVAVYQKELPQPVNQPRVPEGQGNGAIEYVRLQPNGTLDRSFGTGGFLAATGEKAQLIEGESGTVGACAETLAASGSLLVAYEGLPLEQLSPTGAVVTRFGVHPSTQTPTSPAPVLVSNNSYHFCNGLFALPNGSVEGISGKEISRLTPTGTPEATFGTAGITRIDVPTEAAAIAANGETFAAGQSHHAVTITGILANGQPDPTLGSAAGQQLPIQVPRPAGTVPGNEETPTWEVLTTSHSLTIRVGEELVRLSN